MPDGIASGAGTIPRVVLLFEYPTLNGGERSMLAVLDRLMRGSPSATVGSETGPLSGSHSATGTSSETFAGGWEFAAVAPPSGDLAQELRLRNIPLFPLSLREAGERRPPAEKAAEKLFGRLQNFPADIVHANSLSMGRLLGKVAERLKVPCVAHLRDILRLSRAAVQDLNRNTRLIAVSEATRSFHLSQGLDPVKTLVIYNGVDTEQFRPRRGTGWLRADLGLPESAFLVLTVGQIGLRKGHNILAEAAVSLKEKLPQVHYLIAGQRHSEKEESVQFERCLLQQFAEAGMSDRLHCLGYRHDVSLLMNEADLLVHPALQEPFGRVLLEAASSGLPIVATHVGGTAEMLSDGLCARLIPPDNASALAAALEELVFSPAQRRRLAAAARERIVTCFTLNRAATEMSACWRSLIP